MTYTEEHVSALASRYAEEMIDVQPEGAFVLGGNCQGARIAQAIARRLRELDRDVSLLFLMEQRQFRPYDGWVALIFGRHSHFNPYTAGADPDAGFRRMYPAGFTVDIITGTHGRFFERPNIESLAAVVKTRLAAVSEAGVQTAPTSAHVDPWLTGS
jgi:thioesterase domain-containing protein